MTALAPPPLPADAGPRSPGLPPSVEALLREEAAPRPRGLLRRVLQDRSALLSEIVDGERIPLGKVVAVSLALSALGGLAIGSASGLLQALAAAAKVPVITLGALLICFPALYIFGLLQGSRVSVEQVLRIFAVGLGLRGAIIAGLAPLLLFFSSVGTPYGMLLLGALLAFGLAECGLLHTVEAGVRLLRERTGDPFGLALTRVWMVVYLGVSAQLVWSLRPLIRHPDITEFVAFGGPGGNMFAWFLEHVVKLVG